MYTVIVADDEEELRSAVVGTVDWESIGFKVVGQAENGIEALELVEKLEPDLLLTDIKMPFISGIELARQVREIRPAMHIAFLSGYDDFSFAQQAIEYNIISYLLKPISLKELTHELIKIKEKIDAINQEFKNSSKDAAEADNQSKLENFLMPLLLDNTQIKYTANGESPELEAKAEENHFKRGSDDSPSYIVIVTRIEDQNSNNCTRVQHVNSVNTILRKYVRFGSFYSNGKVVSLLSENQTELRRFLHILVSEIVQNMERVLGAKCYIGVGRETKSLAKCSISFNEAVTAIGYASEHNRVRYIADMEHSGNLKFDFVEQSTAKLENLLKVGDEKLLVEFLDNLFVELKQNESAKSDIDLFIMQMIATVCQSVNAVADSKAAEEFFSTLSVSGNIFMIRTLDEMQKQLLLICLSAKSIITNQRKLSSEIICDNAVQIINEDYGDETLSLVSLSDRLHVSSNYLSALIKKTKGDTFVNLLTAKRMNIAKDLILCSSMKVLEISNKCGYSDQHYFSYCFKKYFGISPNKMRESAPVK